MAEREAEYHVNARLKHDVYGSFHESGISPDEWDQVIASGNGDLYSSYEWCRIWWKHYGDGRRLHLFVFRRGGRLEAVIPFFSERLSLAGIAVHVGRLVGSDHTPAMVNASPGSLDGAFLAQVITQYLFQEIGCDVVAWGPTRRGNETADWLGHCLNQDRAGERQIAVLDRGPTTVFDLPDSFESYLQCLDKRQRGNYRRDYRGLAEGRDVRVDVITDSKAGLQELRAFVDLHQAQWNETGKRGHFADWPAAVEFTRDLVEQLGARGMLRLFRLWADEHVVSYQLCFSYGGRYFWRLPARLGGEPWDRLGLGRVGLVTMIEQAIGEGIKQIEAGRGHYDYKLRFGGREEPLSTVLVIAPGRLRRMRWGAFSRISLLYDLLYYRIWFNRVAPRLPWLGGELRSSWIRTRL